MKSIVVDANVILRYLLEDNEILFNEAKQLFDKTLKREVKLIIKQLILAEVVYVLEKVYQVSKAEISEILTGLILLKGIKIEDKEILLKALAIYKDKNIDFADAVLCAISERYEVKSFDKKLNNCVKSRVKVP